MSFPQSSTISVIGLPVAATSYAAAIDWIKSAALKADRAYAVEAANTHVAALARHDTAFGEVMSKFDLICPDGMPLVWSVNLVWVGLGCPKQEHWIAKYKDQLPAAVYFGIGAAFAFHAGEVKQAPGWIQKYGIEWAYRLCKEPRRLFKRYFTYNSLFVYYSLRDKFVTSGAPSPSSAQK